MKALLDRFFYPKSIAVLGATDKPEKVGYAVLRNLSAFKGEVFPINPKYRQVQGLRCYAHPKELPQVPDLVVIAVPAPLVPDLIRACGEIGIQAAIVLSAGFRESGPEGEQRFEALRQEATRHGVRLIGPNCLGLMTPAIQLNTTFSRNLPAPGRIALITQSGALGASILDWAIEKNIGFSYFVSVGNMSDIGFEHLIDYFGTDNRTACILIYMEHLANARHFMSAARAFARSKPIIVLKAGASADGAKGVAMHTGAPPGNDAVFDAAFQRAGVIRVGSIQQLFDCAQSVAFQPLPFGKRLAVVTNGGGPAILALDALAQQGGQLANLSPKTLEKLETVLPPARRRANPVDVLGDCSVEHYRASLRACLSDPGTDAVLAILTTQSMTDPAALARALVAESKQFHQKPVYAAWMGLRSVREGRDILEEGKVPWFPFPERAVTAFMHMARYREHLDLLYETPPDLPIELGDIRRADAQAILDGALKDGRDALSTEEGLALLACYGIPIHPPAGWTPPLVPPVFLGAEKDPVFGPVIAFGVGGPYADVWKDRAFALPPLNLALAKHLMESTKVAQILRDAPEQAPSADYLQTMLCRLAYLMMDFPVLRWVIVPSFAVGSGGGYTNEVSVRIETPAPALRERYAHLCISPYPTQWMRYTALADGTPVLLRPIRPEDDPLEVDLVRNSSKESLYFRFFGHIAGLDQRMLSRFTHIDYDREMAIVAQIEQPDGTPKLIGVARIVGDGWRDMAEFAILIPDAWQKHGLGGMLTDYLLEIARTQGYRKIHAAFLKANGSVRRLLERKGFQLRAGRDESDYAELDL